MEDLAIIELYFARDERAISKTEAKYKNLCHKIAFNILGNEEDAEECLNDAYLTIWNSVPPMRPVYFSAFICKIVRNLSLRKLVYNNAQKRNPAELVSFDDFSDFLSDSVMADNMDKAEIGKLINDFLKTKSPVVKAVFIRKYFFCDSICDIAAKYSFSESKVKSMLYIPEMS